MERQEELLLQKRWMDLSRMANRKGLVLFSNFLNLNELNLFHQVSSDMETPYRLSGGYEFAERQMIAFIPDALSYAYTNEPEHTPLDFPIACLHFQPRNSKFAEKLTHRDVLGACMHLGVERYRIGDIRLDEQNYYIFCEEGISEYFLESLTQIRHTMITGGQTEPKNLQWKQTFEHLSGIVASVRLDTIVAFLLKKSRGQGALLIQSQKVFINDRAISSKSYECKPGDVISIRGFGKYIFVGSDGETRKGRIKISLKKYK